MIRSCLLLLLLLTFSLSAAESSPSVYEQRIDLVFGEVDGTGLLMDVFVPTGKKNGMGVIDIASGAWYSDRGKIKDHQTAQIYQIFCARGYTVFAIRPGSRPRYTLREMDQHVKHGIRYVKGQAALYGIDPTRLGLTGASAGGHLATLAALSPEPGNGNGKTLAEKSDTSVKAVAAFFPPTDFLDWGGKPANLVRLGDLFFREGIAGKSDSEVQTAVKAVSPFHRIQSPNTPFLLIHGDADTVVPLQQSEKLLQGIRAAGGQAELHVKKGGGHPWLTLPQEVKMMADWFDRNL